MRPLALAACAVALLWLASRRRPVPPPAEADGVQRDPWPDEVLSNVLSVTTRPWDRWDGAGDDRDWLASMRASYLGPAS